MSKKNRLVIICILTFLFCISSVIYFNFYGKNTTSFLTSDTPEVISKSKGPNDFRFVKSDQRADKIPVLVYQDIQNTPTSNNPNVIPQAQLAAHLQYLSLNGFTTITGQEFIDAYNGKINLPKKSVLLTFDGGFESVSTIVNPLLNKYGLYAVSFITGKNINSSDQYLTTAEIQQILKEKRITFESNTYDLDKVGKESGVINEVSVAKIIEDNKNIEKILRHKTNMLSYPFGEFSDSAIKGIESANIPFAFAITSGSSNWVALNETRSLDNVEIQNPRALPRVKINANITIAEYRELLIDY